MSLKKELAQRHLNHVFELLSDEGDAFNTDDLAEVIYGLMPDDAVSILIAVLAAIQQRIDAEE